LGSHGIYGKVESQLGRVYATFLLMWKRPEGIIFAIEGFFVKHGVHRVNGLEVLGDQRIGLVFGGKDANHLGDATLGSPVVGERVLGARTKYVVWRLRCVRNIGK